MPKYRQESHFLVTIILTTLSVLPMPWSFVIISPLCMRYSSKSRFYQASNTKQIHRLLSDSSSDNPYEAKDSEISKSSHPSVSLTGITVSRTTLENPFALTSFIDYIFSFLVSDVGSITVGFIGIIISLWNRLSFIDNYDASNAVSHMGQQSRSDLLAVFASGAVLLNGVSKLDVTSVLAQSVALEGITLESPKILQLPNFDDRLGDSKVHREALWCIESVLTATPASTAVVMVHNRDRWCIWIIAGVIPTGDDSFDVKTPTPILDRFLNLSIDSKKESYLPTLQALPGKKEFTYLPRNTQEALIVPLPILGYETGLGTKIILVLGSNTAKSFSPRDIAWCQVLVERLGKLTTYLISKH